MIASKSNLYKFTITVLTIGRPPVVPDINAKSEAVIADFYCENAIIFEIIFGKYSPQGKLSIELPSSVEAVKNQQENVPYDSKDPLYPFGHGLGYTSFLGEKYCICLLTFSSISP